MYNAIVVTNIETIKSIQEDFSTHPLSSVEEYARYGVEGAPQVAKEDRQKVFRNFVEGDQPWIDAELPLIDPTELKESEIIYQALLGRIEVSEASSGETEESALQYERVARKLAEVYRQKEALRTLESGREDRQHLSRERAGHMSQELRGGEVDQPAFQALLAEKLQLVLDSLMSTDTLRQQLSKEYLDIIGMSAEGAGSFIEHAPKLASYERTEETDAKLRKVLVGIYPDLVSVMEPFRSQAPLKASEATPVFQAALEAVGLGAKGWNARLISGSSAKASTSSIEQKEITWGEGRADFDRWKRIETPVHEAFHAVRKTKASEQPDPKKRQKAPGVRAFEEGFVDALAQIVSGRRPVIGKLHYINQGLLFGKDIDNTNALRRTARDIYELEWRALALGHVGEITEQVIADKKQSARVDTYRATRGGPDATDQSYFNGSRIVNPWLNKLASLPPEEADVILRWALSAVFDPTNEDDVRVYGPYPTSQNHATSS